MNIEDLTIKQANELCNMMAGKSAATTTSLRIGECVIIRSVTHYYTGRITSITDTDIKLENATWVADAGQWNNALTSGELASVQPFPDGVTVMRGGMIDVAPWSHELPKNVIS